MKTQTKRLLAILASLCLLITIGSTALVGLADTPVTVTGVGVFDQNPAKGIHTFNENAKTFQITFSDNFYDLGSETRKSWVQSELGDWLKINGKTVSEWNGIEFNSVQIHVETGADGKQFLAFHINGREGLPTEATDSTVEILKGFPVAGKAALAESVTYAYTGGNNVPFKLVEEEPVTVTGVGVFDQTPAKGIHTFNENAKTFQITFSDNFYDLGSETRKSWVQSELGDWLKINGKTVSEWNGIEFNSVQIHVETGADGKQFLAFHINGREGLPTEATDSTVEILKGFPIAGKAALAESVTYAYTGGNNVPFKLVEEEPVTVTGVGVFDQNPAKGIHTFNENAKTFQITFSDNFYDLGSETRKSWVQSELGDWLKINGKTVSEWNGIEFNSVQIHVETGADGKQFLAFHINGREGLPTEATDSTVEILKGFPIAGKAALAESVTYYYTANNNVPFTTENPNWPDEPDVPDVPDVPDEPDVPAVLEVTGVGIFDQTPNKGIHHFSADARMLQITFNRDFYDLEGATRKDHLQGTDLAKYIKINGKTVYDWHTAEVFNSVMIHVVTGANGQFLEVHFNGLTDKLPTELTDSTVELLAGFPCAGGEALAESVTYYYGARSYRVFSTEKPEPIVPPTPSEPDENAFTVTGVGVLDIEPHGAFVDFGSSVLFQAKFSKDLDNTGSMVSADKVQLFVQHIYGDYIAINGKLVSEWNRLAANCVVIHIGKNDALGQYLEFNVGKGVDGLFDSTKETRITFLPGLLAGDNTTLAEAVTYVLEADSTAPFVKADKADDIVLPEPEVPVDPSTIDLDVTEVGVLDQFPKKALHDFGSSFLWQIDFNKDFYDPSQLTGGRKDHLQTTDPELCKYILINGKSVAEWHAEMFNSVQIHVQTNGSFGQYLEMNTNAMLDGLVFPETDNYVTILKGFPCFNGEPLKESVTFTMKADSVTAWERADEAIVPTTTTTQKPTTTTTTGFDIVDDEEPGEGEDKGPQTGDALPLCGFAVLSMSGAAVLVLCRKRLAAK